MKYKVSFPITFKKSYKLCKYEDALCEKRNNLKIRLLFLVVLSKSLAWRY